MQRICIFLLVLFTSVSSVSARQLDFSYLDVNEQLKISGYSVSIDSIINDPLYIDLPHSKEKKQFYKEIELLKVENPHLSPEQLVEFINNLQIFNSNIEWPSIHSYSSSGYEVVKNAWLQLNTYEKVLVVSNPGKAYVTDLTKDKAYSYTMDTIGYNGLGDISDAFRHAIWNALMSKYISESWAYQFATAHEMKSADVVCS